MNNFHSHTLPTPIAGNDADIQRCIHCDKMITSDVNLELDECKPWERLGTHDKTSQVSGVWLDDCSWIQFRR